MIVARHHLKSKYHNRRTLIDGICFASKKEATRYQTLERMQHVDMIRNLKLQPRFKFIYNDCHICDYVADFQYDLGTETIIEDCKGFKTPIYKLKKKLMKAFLGIEVRET